MLGGTEEPCLPEAHLAPFAKHYGRPCPRVPLMVRNEPLASLALLALNPERWGWALGHLVASLPPRSDLGMTRTDGLWRIVRSVSNDRITDLQRLKLEQQLEEQRRKAKSAAERK